MNTMRRIAAGLAFTAAMVLSLAAAQGTAWAATTDAQGGTQITDGRGSTPPKSAVSPKVGGTFRSLGVTWED